MKGDELRTATAQQLIAEYRGREHVVAFDVWVQWQTSGGHHYSKQVQRIARRLWRGAEDARNDRPRP